MSGNILGVPLGAVTLGSFKALIKRAAAEGTTSIVA
jgi:hypothetical protein